MTFVVVYDANVLYPSTLRDVLIRAALAGLVQARWTDQILDEVFRNLKANRPDLESAKLNRTRELMTRVVRDAMVTGYEKYIPLVQLERDRDDRHVVAAAIRAGARQIVTFNLRDFPVESLVAWKLEAVHPDDFLLEMCRHDRNEMTRVIGQVAAGWKGIRTAREVLESLERSGLPETASEMRSFVVADPTRT
ncbi:PIN domain-containing protein [Subtercola vilae]|uniref:PIN domain-containing protein n=1 Tax=Subtercola vilae TaxID=2056433 RepID=A0A4T2BDR4_9MICO|nr:PIN domain-containing protein [Subtercola vilae]TIH29287.1 PIN domain-containing protein [Subtercola vilae]